MSRFQMLGKIRPLARYVRVSSQHKLISLSPVASSLRRNTPICEFSSFCGKSSRNFRILLTIPCLTMAAEGHVTRGVKTEAEKNKYLQMSTKEKRTLYRCGENYTTLKEISTLRDDRNETKEKTESLSPENKVDFLSKLSVFRGDITTLEIDAIVNAANNRLLGGGGGDYRKNNRRKEK